MGCLYHSAYAITGEESLLDHVADTNPARWQLRLLALGLMPFTLFCTDPPEPPASLEWWERLRDRFTRDNTTEQRHAPLLISVPGITPGWLHQVAALMPACEGEDLVCISDSNFAQARWVTWAEFLDTYGARTHRVEMLGPADLNAYPATPHIPGGTP